MAAIQLHSENPNFSFIIQKNPTSGIKLQTIRLGTACGWFSENSQSYNIFFKDAEDEISYKTYKDEEFEYLNLSRYNASLFVMNAIDEFFRSAIKRQDLKDIENKYEHCFMINMIKIENLNYLNAFTNYFNGEYEIEREEIAKQNFRIKIKTKKSIFHLLNFSSLFATFIGLVNRSEYLFINPENVIKNLNMLNIIDAPYFLRYLFKVRFLEDVNKFNKFRNELEKTERYKITMKPRDNWGARFDFVKSQLDMITHILDIGCGEDGKYISGLSQKFLNEEAKYFAIDINPEIVEGMIRKAKSRGWENVHLFNSIEEFKKTDFEEPVDIILSEVIEHMDLVEAKNLVVDVLKNMNINKLLITTPNSDFNKHYFETGKRHEDHKFELSSAEFKLFIEKCIKESSKKDYSIHIISIGDGVNGIHTTSGCIFEKIEKEKEIVELA